MFSLDGIKIEYQEETQKKWLVLEELKTGLEEQRDKITDDILSGTASIEVFMEEIQELIDYVISMQEVCDSYKTQFLDASDF